MFGQKWINPFLATADEIAKLARTKCKTTKENDRVILIEKSGSIPAGARGKVLEVMPFHDWTNPDLKRRVVRFDEYPHNYIVSNDALRFEKILSDTPRDASGRFLQSENS